MDETGQRLLDGCLLYPDDWQSRLIYADWLEDQSWGLAHATVVRNTARHQWRILRGRGRLSVEYCYLPTSDDVASVTIRISQWHLLKAAQPPGGVLTISGSESVHEWQIITPDRQVVESGKRSDLYLAKKEALRALLTCRQSKCFCVMFAARTAEPTERRTDHAGSIHSPKCPDGGVPSVPS